MSGPSEAERPALRIVRGEPDAEELAALTALLSVASGGEDEPVRTLRGGWRDPARGFARMPLAGPGAWRSSGW
ncbi:acyl-CoA carboxylase subunit epsilon [Jatrophihabitans endophyticus]|uniref:acyl-CoA carboxylase subunit epsilon n=1 Tax=Jatrophihabitans endophyticus TaxID=1206085 RepID=UPI0019FA5363|nr:acyl-CoA carboxylase subunit epsilon [Jatrophihabitans endophyticus]MBE7189629.1 acyl-CoA carboxylase subunit epsilon [Jatrophihabitans endophyticus]